MEQEKLASDEKIEAAEKEYCLKQMELYVEVVKSQGETHACESRSCLEMGKMNNELVQMMLKTSHATQNSDRSAKQLEPNPAVSPASSSSDAQVTAEAARKAAAEKERLKTKIESEHMKIEIEKKCDCSRNMSICALAGCDRKAPNYKGEFTCSANGIDEKRVGRFCTCVPARLQVLTFTLGSVAVFLHLLSLVPSLGIFSSTFDVYKKL